NAPAENPLVDASADDVFHHGNFLTATLTLALDKARAALFQAAALSAARCAALMEPELTGLRPFLADGPATSSGLMMLEYVAHSALADLRLHATPATLGCAVLSRGVEEHASFATQAAWRLTDSRPAYETVLACELLAATRAVRLNANAAVPAALRPVLTCTGTALDPRTEDRPLDADLATATTLLPELAEFAEPTRAAAARSPEHRSGSRPREAVSRRS
ncbi:MAG TPA: aromatic amino acid lyase, partial [Actinomycetota bacterium]